MKKDLRLITDDLTSIGELEKQLIQLGTHNVKSHELERIDIAGSSGSSSIIFDCKFLRQQSLLKLLELRKRMTVRSTLVLANEVPIETYRNLFSMNNTAAMQKPYQFLALTSLLAKLEAQEADPAVSFPRFKTDQPIRLIELRSGLLIPSRMRNYSASGAFLEYRGAALRPGDNIQIGFAPNEHVLPQNSIQLKARVVWMKTKAGNVSDRGVGVQFLGKPTPLKNLREA